MPRIDADAPIAGDFLSSSLIYGVSRAGKTLLCATYPRPAIFTSAREGGFLTVQTMARDLRYEPDVKPLIYAVGTGSLKEILPYFKEIEGLVAKGRVKTVVVELTFYAEDLINAFPADEKNGWAKYAFLTEHIQWLDAACKRVGCRVVYNAVAADPDKETRAPGGIQIPGKATGRKIPATTDLTGYLRTEDAKDGAVERVLHLASFGAYPAGHRYGALLPPIVRDPTFRKLQDLAAGKARADDKGNVLYGEAASGASAAGDLQLPPL